MIAIFAPLGEGSLGPLAIGDLVEGWIEGLENYTVKSLAAKTKRKRKQKHGDVGGMLGGCWIMLDDVG